MTRGFLLIGPESSGTKLTAELLRRAGCRSVGIIGGDDGPQLPADDRPRLLRRSFPHGFEWFTVRDLVALLDAEGVKAEGVKAEDVQVVITTRDWFTMVDSQLNRRLAADRETAFANLRRAYREIFAGVFELGLPYLVSSYEALTAQPRYAERLLDAIGLPPAAVECYEANAKWYGDQPARTGPPPGVWTAGQY
ncbi:hypothetical protein HC028_11685 [Planosporangium flavigriseum]|uniref:Sulfotransferase family protein n=1 Tax=Planosporangium flavigriseum TaxID=373681 RepID=A0A8J3LV83_9ACTN|nr:hypothetical protein [Planosporangium flavigriseum]NJC65157.1 hypothetical protein [Planosporangium flavigriseum]GIG71775.1 hypothetical protein Pfl04_01790 [Planosporangium flavigriseum]